LEAIMRRSLLSTRARFAALSLGVALIATGCVTTVEERLADGSLKVQRFYPWESPEKNGGKPSQQLMLAHGQFMEQQGQATEARESYEKVLRKDSHSIEAMVGLARLDSLAGRTEDAEKKLKEAERLAPKSPVVQAAYGQFYADRKDYPEALARFQQALRDAPENQSIRTQYAQTLARAGNFDQSLAQFTQAVGEPAAYYNLGLILHEQGRDEEAEAQFVEALTRNPKLTQAQVWLDSLRDERERVTQASARSTARASLAQTNPHSTRPFSGPAYSGPASGPAADRSGTGPVISASATQPAGQHTHPKVQTAAAPLATPHPAAQPLAAPASSIPQPPPGLTPAQLEQWHNQFRNP
jgi:tetratricopeptide (TPR) repeat protein